MYRISGVGGMAGTICLRIFLMLFVGILWLGSVSIADNVTGNEDESGEGNDDFVNIEADSDVAEIGDDIHLSGMIDRSLLSGSPSDVVILISAPEGSLADTFILSTPNRHGAYEYFIPADVGGDWGFEALYTGMYSPKINVEVVPAQEPGKTALTISGWPAYPRVGEDVSFKGRLTDSSGKGIPNREIVYEFVSSHTGCITGCRSADLDATGWIPAGHEQTDLSGAYRFVLPVVEEGGVNIRVRFEGDEQYSSCESRVLGISATSP